MELRKAIKERRSIRHFNNQKIDKELLKEILEYGILAPSAKNRQPWHFIVINNQEQKEKIAQILEEKTDVSTSLTCEAIRDCSSFILVYGDIENEIMDVQSIGACIENIILAAKDLDIGSLWIGYIKSIESELKDLFKCDKELIAGIALGYTDTNPKERPRKKLEEVSIWYY